MGKRRLSQFATIVLALASSWLMSGCTRNFGDSQTSRVILRSPSQKTLSKVGALAFPTTGQLCWGASVTGDGIVPAGVSCGPALGTFGGFVPDGGVLALDVPQGKARTIRVFAYHAAPGEPCPTWHGSLSQLTSVYGKTYKVGEVIGVDLEATEVAVDVAVTFPGDSQNVLATLASAASLCSGSPASPSTLVLSSGQVVKVDSSPWEGVDVSHPTVRSAFQVGTNRGAFTQAGEIILPASTVTVSPQVSSLTYKHDTQKFYGLRHDGSIVEVNSSSGAITELAGSAQCPFVTCQVPPWLQAISAGNAQDLFALDHGGNLYTLDANGIPLMTNQKLPENATHFY